MKIEPIGSVWLEVEYEKMRGVKFDFQIYGLRAWKDRVVTH